MRGDIVDIITHANVCDNRFRVFGVLIPSILPFSIGMADCLYNSVSTTVLHGRISEMVQDTDVDAIEDKSPVHTSNHVEATFDFVERIVRLIIAFDNVALTLLLVWTRLNR